jgi:hypothetical protein
VSVLTYQAFASTELLGQLALERVLAKLSTRRYPAGLEPSAPMLRPLLQGLPSRRSPAGSSPGPSAP